jgi:hypothetical protein
MPRYHKAPASSIEAKFEWGRVSGQNMYGYVDNEWCFILFSSNVLRYLELEMCTEQA